MILTPRQRDVLTRLAEGETNKQIARALGIGTHSVQTHLTEACKRMKAKNRTHAAVKFIREFA